MPKVLDTRVELFRGFVWNIEGVQHAIIFDGFSEGVNTVLVRGCHWEGQYQSEKWDGVKSWDIWSDILFTWFLRNGSKYLGRPSFGKKLSLFFILRPPLSPTLIGITQFVWKSRVTPTLLSSPAKSVCGNQNFWKISCGGTGFFRILPMLRVFSLTQ